ncbi:MAG: hypothetical protein EOO55_04930 [Hymenobacter sp.]|nr:MAG: hypothetical protein EOO55_04930 [Hymenobacter sp.]
MYKNTKNSRLELNNDSSFYIKDVAAIWSPFSSTGGFEDIKGCWSLVKHQEWWAISFTVKSVRVADGRWNQKDFGAEAMLVGQEAPYRLHFTVGDPDAGKAIQFELK